MESTRLRVDGGNTDPVLSRYATSGRRLLVKAQMLHSSTWLGPPHWPGALFPSHLNLLTLEPKLCQADHTLNSLEESLTEMPS